MQIIIPGDPISKKRPRFARRGKFVAAINDQETEEGKVFLLLRDQIKAPMKGPLEVYLRFFIRRPQSHYGTGKNAGIIKASAPEYPDRKPDLDNCEKFYLDVLNGVAWEDDCQICAINSSKSWAGGIFPAQTIITVEQMNGSSPGGMG